jgi:hypothetical protein
MWEYEEGKWGKKRKTHQRIEINNKGGRERRKEGSGGGKSQRWLPPPNKIALFCFSLATKIFFAHMCVNSKENKWRKKWSPFDFWKFGKAFKYVDLQISCSFYYSVNDSGSHCSFYFFYFTNPSLHSNLDDQDVRKAESCFSGENSRFSSLEKGYQRGKKYWFNE